MTDRKARAKATTALTFAVSHPSHGNRNVARMGHPKLIWFRGLLVGQGFDAGEFFAFQEFEAGSAAGGDVGDFVGYSGLVDCRY